MKKKKVATKEKYATKRYSANSQHVTSTFANHVNHASTALAQTAKS